MACGASKNLNNFRNGLAIDLRHSGSTKMTTLACFILLIVQIAAMPAMDGVTSIGATLAQTGKISSKPSKASILEEGTSRDPVTSHPINYPRVDPIDLTGPVAKPASLNHENILAANQYAGKSEDTAATNRINYPRMDPDLTEARGPTTVPTTSNHENQVTAHEESPKKDEASLKKNKESLKLSSEPDDAPKKTPKPVAHEETPEVDPEKNLAPEVKAARKGFRKRLRKYFVYPWKRSWYLLGRLRSRIFYSLGQIWRKLRLRKEYDPPSPYVHYPPVYHYYPPPGHGHVQTPPHDQSHHGQVQQNHVSPATPAQSHDESQGTHQHTTPVAGVQPYHQPHGVNWAYPYPAPEPIAAYPASLGQVNGLTPTTYGRSI